MKDWLTICHHYATRMQILQWTSVLQAFGGAQGGSNRQYTGFESLYAEVVKKVDDIAKQIVLHVSTEVDLPQAEMFSNRFLGVVEILRQEGHPAAKMFLIGLVLRTQEILCHGDSLALRVRAIVDFYYSQGARLAYCDNDTVDSLEDLIDRVSWSNVEQGIIHGQLCGVTQNGPIYANILKLTERTIWPKDFRGLAGVFSSQLEKIGCAHGVSGGFFLYSEADICFPEQRGDPVGLLVSQGVICNPPVFNRGALLQYADGQIEIRRLGMEEVAIVFQSETIISPFSVNQVADLGTKICCFNRAFGTISPTFNGSVISIAGHEVLCKSNEPVSIPLNGFVLCFPNAMLPDVAEGESVSYQFLNGRALVAGIAGGPILLHCKEPTLDLASEDFSQTAPPITFSQDETFDQNLLPRLGVGITASQELIFVAVDGRNFEKSLGITLHGLAKLLANLGCVAGLNLDGGSSKRMVVGGRMVDLSRTTIETANKRANKIRPIRSGIAILPN